MVLAQKQKYDQLNRREDPEMNSPSYTHLIFYKGIQNMREKRQPLQQILLGKLSISMHKTEIRSMFFTLYKFQLKMD
jgi:hypothetical protein